MKRVIIVEDDPMISEIYQKKFSEAGFEVLAANSGEEAINLLKKEKADLMVLDLIMPKMNGFEVLEEVRKNISKKDLKIFIFSNLSQKEDQDKAMKLGADRFIIKSEYAPTDLVREVIRLAKQYDEEKRNKDLRPKEEGEKLEKNGKKKVLLIEDEKIFLEMFGDKLKQDGYNVETAENGSQGLKLALKKNFDVFVIDTIMPDMAIDEIMSKIKMEDKTKDVPVIALSASAEEQTEEKIKELNINEFFVKTKIIPSELSKKVEELIGK